LSGSTASATCSVTYTPGGTGSRTDTITANYPGDTNHFSSTNTYALTVNPPVPDEPPVATIQLITPNPSQTGQPITFTGTGTDSDGTITGYMWRSSISGIIGTSSSFTISSLPAGTHTIYFSVQDSTGAWSQEVSTVLTITGNNSTGSSAQYLGLPTEYWIIVALALAGVGVFIAYFVAVKKKKQQQRPYNAPMPVPPGVSPPPPASPGPTNPSPK
jgi:hypothetical protein